ncbi:hypothetical protein [Imperialibacter roseus]|uniref:Phosphate/sulfate permease n=1 Tax=Imperialibacter roseus TaxID=1324217 RepID=A0ABZ0INZ4_9BACT|nr:hypothetical protein [Imperialibacter roseus]WOK06738.1 hypothetical protein RT717_27085 [Imperialibacter roseus]|tara:strand:- start:9684 stop:10814 length:1131 start_codon:yes stop_codon:yes gene_type:complete
MSSKPSDSITTQKLGKGAFKLFSVSKKERNYLYFLLAITFVCGMVYPYQEVAMWVAFALAGYSAIANDSIQTIGTFISSNSHRKWYHLWLFMGLIFLVTVTYSWITYGGDVSYQRLNTKGLEVAPTSFSFLQVAAPVILLVLTRLRMPVSTSILLLSAFSTKASSIGGILSKSLVGYALAFVIAIIVWTLTAQLFDKYAKKKPAHWWAPLQWLTSGALWSVWIMQDAANIAVVLPRALNTVEFVAFASFIFLGLGVLFYLKGDKIQSIVEEKADITDVRAATIVDLVYACLLYYLKVVNTIPISTTWVFIGLLGGRELAINYMKKSKSSRRKGIRKSLKLIGKDALYAGIGLVISILLALSINDDMRKEFFDLIGW